MRILYNFESLKLPVHLLIRLQRTSTEHETSNANTCSNQADIVKSQERESFALASDASPENVDSYWLIMHPREYYSWSAGEVPKRQIRKQAVSYRDRVNVFNVQQVWHRRHPI